MHQSREIAIQCGFKPGEDVHFIWALRENIKTISKKIEHNLKEEKTDPSEETIGLCAVRFELLTNLHLLDPQPQKWLTKHGILETIYWYCARCGSLDPEEVTFEEKCSLCGGDLPI